MVEVFFGGAAGLMEGKYHQCTVADGSVSNIAVVFGPNPLFGGTMQNKVVYSTCQSLALSGFSTLRFNFRGVGRSAGSVSSDLKDLQEQSVQDATAAMDWLQTRNKGFGEFWVAGFSFGAWVAMQAAVRRPEVTGMILVCPPVGKYDLAFISPCPVPCVVVHASDDAVIPEPAVSQFVSTLNKSKHGMTEYYVVNNTNHFFNAALPELSHIVMQYVAHRASQVSSRRDFVNFRERKRRKAPTGVKG